jgi:hypothetical protein
MRDHVVPSFIAVFALSNFAIFSSAPDFDISSPKRQSTVIESYIEHEWWLLAWADNKFACQVFVEKGGLPALPEIKADCTAEVYKLWLEQPLCSAAVNGQDPSSCHGYYLYYAGSHPAERETIVELPPAGASVNLLGCTQSNYKIICPLLPKLSIQGIEPLPNYAITQVSYQIDAPPNFQDESGVCSGSVCEVPLSLTSTKGERISFWADSSFGDSSELYEAYYRIKPNGDGRWQVVALSGQVAGIRTQASALEWRAFPPLGENPIWLSYPKDAAALASSEPYQYLAGRLIDARIE